MGGGRTARKKTSEPCIADPPDVAGEVDQHGELGTQLAYRCERRAGVVGEEDPRHDRQVARRRHRQELGQTLNYGQNDNLPPRHRRRQGHDDDRTG